MAMAESNRRIIYALHLVGWDFEHGNRDLLKRDAVKLAPSEYQMEMDGTLFCPVCFTNLNRVPKQKEHFSNGREAYFCHLPAYKEIKCDLRSSRPEGKRYETHEEAQKAIDDESLVIVSGFMKDKPEFRKGLAGEYEETLVEDLAGPISDVPIARHTGESFKLPSKITTVAGICRNFDTNLYKYYYFPNQKYSFRLVDLLHSVERIQEIDDKPKLYFGIIESTVHLGEQKKPDNIRMTYLRNNQQRVKDFCIKLQDRHQKSHGITDASIGRIVIVYGKISDNGTGLCFQNLGWGEFALLPRIYEGLLS
ncbi:hypothetical protein [Zhongshania sp.]|jgi:hypothetical protein|uniref:hypothetical protein n=1 Tax=Zhongshania sp. TaxID=1971902 RepID=UPI002A838400|nr:hypothetical protein [Zhongshania sp.]